MPIPERAQGVALAMMAHQEQETAQFLRAKRLEAIDLAMHSRWEEAVDVNRGILRLAPNDAETHNRLGKALMEMGHYQEAKEAFVQALALRPRNAIALKNLERLKRLEQAGPFPKRGGKAPASLFVEESGKTSVTRLQGLAPRQTLAAVTPGDPVSLKCLDKAVWVESAQGELLGHLEPRLALRLTRLIQGGNRYAAAVTSTSDAEIAIIIREVYRHPAQADIVSFPGKVDSLPAPGEDAPLPYEDAAPDLAVDGDDEDGDGQDLLGSDAFPPPLLASEDEEDEEF